MRFAWYHCHLTELRCFRFSRTMNQSNNGGSFTADFQYPDAICNSPPRLYENVIYFFSFSGGQWKCFHCSRSFSCLSTYTHHKAMHRGETTCPICMKILSQKGSLSRHMAKLHPEFSAWNFSVYLVRTLGRIPLFTFALVKNRPCVGRSFTPPVFF